MKKLILILFLGFFLGNPTSVGSQTNWTIKSFDSSIEIKSDGVVQVSETIKVNFQNLEKHGIFRELPYQYKNSDGTHTYLEFSINQVLRNGNTEDFSQTTSDGLLVLKIGDPDKTLSGEQTYQISYQVVGALKGYSEFDELYWNVTGNGWEVEIEKATAAVTLPKEGLIQQSCYQGGAGSIESCLVDKDSETIVNFSTTKSLLTAEGLTIAVGYSKGMVPLLVGESPKTIWNKIFEPASMVSGLTVLLIGIISISYLWLKKGRDSWFGRNYLFGKREETKPVGETETIAVEFSPPENLRPAELAALMDEKVQTLDVTATLVDLANRGFLTIKEEPKKWVFGNSDYVFSSLKKDSKELREYEEELLLRLFDDSDETRLSKLKNKFYKDLAIIKEKLYQNLVDQKFFQDNPTKVRLYYSLGAGIVILLGAGLIWLGSISIQGILFDSGVGLVLVGIVFLIIAQAMPRRTALGRQMYARAKGYYLFIDKAEKYRQQFFEKKNLFNEVLPYAIAFGMTEKFAKAFEKMGLEPDQPSWYSGSRAFNTMVFASSMNSFSNSVSSSMASTPSSSGSGGGGSSGGGFGGGGGGSW